MSILFNPHKLHVELSSKCMLKCPRCPRTELDPEGLNREIRLSEFQQAFPPDLIKNAVEFLFCGDIGDPIYARDIIPICAYIHEHGDRVSIHIVTNGSYKDSIFWRDLGRVLQRKDTVTFSVDGWDQDSNNQYRVNSNYDSIIEGAKILRANTEAQMEWSMIYFSFNESYDQLVEQQAKDLGFDFFTLVESNKFDGRYLVDGHDWLKPTKNFAPANGPFVTVQRMFKPPIITGPSWKRNAHPWARCLNWVKELFINVDGLVFPCPWFNSGYMDNDFVQKYRDKISIKTRSLMEVLEDPLWEELVTRFEVAPLPICSLKCRNAA